MENDITLTDPFYETWILKKEIKMLENYVHINILSWGILHKCVLKLQVGNTGTISNSQQRV